MEQHLFALPELSRQEFQSGWPHHGKSYGYKTGCRCQQCVDAYRADRRQQKANRRANAGRPRTCKACGTDYHYAAHPDHGTTYCAECRLSGVSLAYEKGRVNAKPEIPCLTCHRLCRSGRRYIVCDECYEKLPEFLWEALRKHNAPPKFVQRVWLAPECETCNKRLDIKYRDSRGRMRGHHAIDHDHSCCSGPISCGDCIRGLLCQNCNAGLGYLKEDLGILTRAYDYLSSPFQPWKVDYKMQSGVQ